MYRLILFFSVLIIFVACSNKSKIPKDVLPQSKMQKVMWDMFRADEFVTAFAWNNDTAVDRFQESIELYEQIFKIHNTTKEQFQKSLSYYREHPELLKAIVDSLSEKEHSYRENDRIKPSGDTISPKNILPVE